MKGKTIITGIAALLIMFACNGKKESGNEVKEVVIPEYHTVLASGAETTLISSYPAIIRGQEDIQIKPRLEGFVDAIYVDEGTVVKKGQKLFEINNPAAEQAVAALSAAISSVKAQVNIAKLDVERMQPLADKGIISDVHIQTLKNVYESAIAAEKQAIANYNNAVETNKWSTVISPVDGLVGTITYRQGSLVDKNSVLTTVANTNNIYAYFTLSEKILMDMLRNAEGDSQIEKIKNMPPVTLTLADGTEYIEKGYIETIAGQIDVTTGSVNVRARFANPLGLLRSGASGNVFIPRQLNDVVVISQKSTFKLQDKTLVYKVQGDSVVQKVIDIIEVPDGKSYVITKGLEKGERYVTEGLATLSDGKKIKAID